ncbi:lysophospholipid acyltransferase family protein [Orrella sp. JC864]|uniref:lysophospholipid acyltransferase family protein n=1 Tax=Orrella sp. JC864 TaxID=3120298 RepID=UPI0012BD116E
MLLALFRLLACLPLPWLQGLGRGLGRLVYALPGKYRDRLRANAAQAGYDDPAFARRAAGETGAMILELARVWFRGERSLAQVVSDDEAMVQAVRDEGRGILYLTPHLGCFEITARYVARIAPLTVMFRPPRKAALAPIMQVARQAEGLQVVPATQAGVRAFVRALRAGQAIGMLPDQAPGVGEGVWAPFFGRMAYSVTLPGKLATQTRVPVILVAGERLPRGQGWRMHYVRVPEPLPDSPQAQAALINQTMETLIRRFPEQYLWGYHRYKTPKGAPPAPGLPGAARAAGQEPGQGREHGPGREQA